MGMMVHVALIVSLVRLMIVRDAPMRWAGVYAAVWFAVRLPTALAGSDELVGVFIGLGAVLLAATAFFGLLSRLEDGVGWWLVVLAGNMLLYAAGEWGQAIPSMLASAAQG